MPAFTWLKAPVFWLFGVNLYSLRLPSVLAIALVWFLLGLSLLRRKETLAAFLLVLYGGLSYFDFSHARLGLQDPVLVFFCAASVFLLDRALETGASIDFVLAGLLAAATPLVKTSGLFLWPALLLGVLHARFVEKKRLPWRPLGWGVLAGSLLLGAVALFWFYPHWLWTRRYFMWEVADRKTPDLRASVSLLARMTAAMAPVPLLFALARLFWARRRLDRLDALLGGWLFFALLSLAGSSFQYWRWTHWYFAPLVALAARQAARLKPKALAAAAFLGVLAFTDLPSYAGYYRHMTFFVRDTTPQIEKTVGDAVVSGSGFDIFASDSAKLHYVCDFDYSLLSACWQVERAFPAPDKQPEFVSVFGGPPSNFARVKADFFRGCPAWASRYRFFAAVRRADPRYADLWFVRKK